MKDDYRIITYKIIRHCLIFRATCGPDGKWSHPLPSCLSPCIVPEIVNGRMEGFNIGAKVEHGWAVAVNCSEDYEVGKTTSLQIIMNTLKANSYNDISCQNGTWSSVPSCVPARCKTIPAPPSNGMIVVADTNHGSVGLFQCKGATFCHDLVNI